MNETLIPKVAAILAILTASACSTARVENSVAADSNTAPTSTPTSTAVQIKCINQNFHPESDLMQFENKFTMVPYRKLKTPGKKQKEEDQDETDDLYFARVSKMAEKILIDAGLKKSQEGDKDVLTIGLSWNTKKKRLSQSEVNAVLASSGDPANFSKLKHGEVYLSVLAMKAVGADKKTTRWQINLESLNTDTFYLNVLPPLFLAGKEYVGKNCDAVVGKWVPDTSPELTAIREVQ